MKTDPTFWILARSSGLTAYALLTASVLLGLLVKARPLRSLRPAAAVDLHRFVSTLAITAVGVHGIALVLDKAVPISIQALVLPGVAAYKPFWTGLGVVAADLMVVIIASFSLRRLIGARRWRALHWATYLIFAAATLHGIAAGTDTREPWALALYGGSLASVAFAASWRALVPAPHPAPPATRVQPTVPANPSQGGNLNDSIPNRDRPVAV